MDSEFSNISPKEEDQESVYSWQGYETAWVADSGEDWTNSSDEETSAEYEVASDSSEKSDRFTVSSSSDVPEINLDPGTSVSDSLATAPATDSESIDMEELVDNANIAPQAWKCLKCAEPTAAPMKFCVSCYQKRKCSFPPRPRRKKLAKSRKSTSTSFQSSTLFQTGTSSLSEFSRLPLATTKGLCSICQSRTPNGGFLHNNTVHSIYCYLCSKKAFSCSKQCPLCRRTIQKAVRIFNN